MGDTENGENAPVYCICRKPDINCFMIGCDHCNEWFHGHCINITEKMAKAIREWYCMQCREKYPHLEIKYRHKKSKDRDKDPERDENDDSRSDKRRNSTSSGSKVITKMSAAKEKLSVSEGAVNSLATDICLKADRQV
ncbi:CXXC-type zinc finger protein 1-like [Gastrophryne carolinensis]